MKHHALIALSVLALAACGGSETPAPETPAPEVPVTETPPPASPVASEALTPDGWGPLKIGMTKDEVVAAVGDTRTPDAAGIPGSECVEFQPQRAPDGLWVMLEAGKLTRITVGEMSTVKTNTGLGIGDTADTVIASNAYIKRSPHKYQDAPAEYLTLWSTPQSEPYVQDESARGIVFEIDGTGKVGAIHAGGPSIQYVEGCA
jgi:hypothetical protein